jgi:Spy/CpxP family protein refolding chaperone
MRLRIGVLLMGAALASQAQSPGPGRPGPRDWWENPLASGLNLTDAQRRQIQVVTRDFRNRLVDARATVEKAEGELSDIFNDGNADDRRASDAIDRLARARGELTRVVSQMSLRLRGVLTAEQWQELQRRDRGRGSGWGVPPPLRGPSPGDPGGFRRRPGPPRDPAPGPPPNVAPPKPAPL